MTGKFFAALLGLEHPEKYTGHWVRRTTLSIGGDRGMTAPQLMGLGGHRSIQSVMRYIDRAPSYPFVQIFFGRGGFVRLGGLWVVFLGVCAAKKQFPLSPIIWPFPHIVQNI